MRPIRAAVCREFCAPLAIEELRLRPPGQDEVEVTVRAVAICQSDISMADGGFNRSLPAVYGHEAAGHVSAVGAGIADVSVGDPVLVTLIRACGSCPTCAGGRPTVCRSKPNDGETPIFTADGTPVHQGLDTGAFAEAVVVHRSQIAPIPADLPMESACLISCGVITGLGAAVNTAGVRPGETVVVIGAGGVGLNAIQGARLAGAARVIAVDLRPEKLAAARAFGATDGVLAGDDKPWRAARQIAGRAADAVLVAVGLPDAYDNALRYLRPGGRLVMVGMPHAGQTARYEPMAVALLGQDLRGSMMGDTVLARDIPWIIDLYRQGRIRLDELISGRWPLEEINAAIAETRSGATRRNVILF